ncbi:hypothetical protein B566_EDAN012455 [Ephemera danica]|nr:hypothetical protein B566_EDAN012455 [Ephemera danica]
MAPDTRPFHFCVPCENNCDTKTKKMCKLKCSWTLISDAKCTMLFLLLLATSFINLAGGELHQSTFSHSVSSESFRESSGLLPQSSEASLSELESSRPAIPSTGNSQVFSTALPSAGSVAESSSLAPWELPGSRTDEVSESISSSSVLSATQISQIQPTSTLQSVSNAPSSPSSVTAEENQDGATLINEIVEESSSKTVAHIDRFQPTISEAMIEDTTGDVSSSETIRLARSIDHSATASAGSRQLLQGKVPVVSGERLPSEEKTIPLPVVPPRVSVSGEARRAPRLDHAPDAVGPAIPPQLKPNPSWINASPRRSEPDIQDIITGIVKLLGGNVNVAAVPGPPPHNGRPLRPMGVRINNRGPPRITDVIYESTPSSTIPNVTQNSTPGSTRQPPPYPFDRPPSPPPSYQHIPFPGMENSESFMSPPPLPQEASSPSPKPPQRPRPSWPRPQLPNRRPVYPDVPQVNETTTPESAPPSEEPSSTTSTTTTTTESETTSAAATTPQPPTIPEGVGVATPVQLESSIPELVSTASSSSSATPAPPVSASSSSRPAYLARPGLVLDDPEFKPGGAANVPIITAPIRGHLPPGHGEVFDVTVTAVQGPGGANTGRPQIYQVPVNQLQQRPGADVITRPEEGQDFVSIDGKRTYINLFPTEAGGQGGEATAGTSPPGQRPSSPTPTSGQQQQQPGSGSGVGPVIGTGFAVADPSVVPRPGGLQPSKPPQAPGRRPPSFTKRPPVRIDTCIVGDASTCDEAQNEACRTEQGVSSCHCRPGYSRRKHRDPCRRVVSVMLMLRVDRVYETRTAWSAALSDPESEDYQRFEWEAVRALDSAMGMTPFSDEFMGARVNGYVKPAAPSKEGLLVNATLLLTETAETARPQVKQDIQRHLLGVITRRNNNVGDSALWVDKPPGAVSALQDIDECSSPDLNDCNSRAHCTNVFGTFRCSCTSGLRDPWAGNVQRSGRTCEARRWNREQQKAEMLSTRTGITSPVFSYMAAAAAASSAASVKSGMPPPGAPASYVSVEDRLRWAHIADVMAQNHYAVQQPEPCMPTRPSSAMFGGYPSLTGTLPHLSLTMQHLRPPPPPLQGPPSSSDDEDQRDLLGRNFHVPRPRSRAASVATSMDQLVRCNVIPEVSGGGSFTMIQGAFLLGVGGGDTDAEGSNGNQSGIYYDLDYETAMRPTPIPAPRSTLPRPPPQSPPPIPMATYMQQGRFFRN